MRHVRVGTASWTDRTLLASGWYPPEADTAEKRLRYYARQFSLVEVDSSYHALPARATAAMWAQRTPAGFTFNVKAFSLFTHHPTKVSALPADLRPAVEKTGMALRRVCVEFSNPTWMSHDNQQETLAFLSDHQVPYVCVDMPQGYKDSIPPVLAATAGLAVVRLHGHSGKWDSKDIHERFGYRYSNQELTEWAPKVAALAENAAETHVLFNNCYRDYAQTNAQQLANLLTK